MKLNKVLRIPIEQDPRFDDLLRVYREQVIYCVHKTVTIGSYSMFKLHREVYRQLREKYPEYNSQIIVNAYKLASETVKGCIKLCQSNKRTKFPNLSEISVITLRKQDINFDSEHIEVIYKPFERIEVRVFPSEKQRQILKSAKAKGAHLAKRDGRWMFYLIVEKEVWIPSWEDCETVVGVDIGINYLSVATAITKDGKVHKALFNHGKEWRHLQLKKRGSLRRLQSRGAHTGKVWEHYNDKLDELLHIASKRIVEYAQGFPRPIIVLENLRNMRSGGRNRKWNYLLGNWARSKLQRYIRYKAEWEGIPIDYTSPYRTSKTCFYCGAQGQRKGKHFVCPECDRRLNADWNGSANIAERFRSLLVTRGIVEGLSPIYKGQTYRPEASSHPTCMAEMKPVMKPEAEPC